MSKTDFERVTYTTLFQQIDVANVTLTAGAAAAEVIATFNTEPLSRLTVTVDVSVAALTGMEVWVRGDKNGRWFQLAPEQALAYGRTDTLSDVKTTSVGNACFLTFDCLGWSDIQLKAKSAGAAKLRITAGGK